MPNGHPRQHCNLHVANHFDFLVKALPPAGELEEQLRCARRNECPRVLAKGCDCQICTLRRDAGRDFHSQREQPGLKLRDFLTKRLPLVLLPKYKRAALLEAINGVVTTLRHFAI